MGVFFNRAESEQGRDPINRSSFLIALGLLVFLLVVAIIVDQRDWVDDPAPYIGLVSTTLGAVLGFIGGEASGSR